MRQGEIDKPHRADQVDANRLLHLLGARSPANAAVSHAGIVHDHVEPPELVERRPDQPLKVAVAGDVGRDRTHAISAAVGDDRLELRLAAPGQDHAGALLVEADGKTSSEPRAGPGDDRHFVSKFHCRSLLRAQSDAERGCCLRRPHRRRRPGEQLHEVGLLGRAGLRKNVLKVGLCRRLGDAEHLGRLLDTEPRCEASSTRSSPPVSP